MEKKSYISYIRAFACMSIVILHSFTMYGMVYKDELFGGVRKIINLIPYLMMWGVPCFVMVTGALLLSEKKEFGYKKVFCSYISRILIALFVCSYLFRLLDLWMNKESFSLRVLWEPLYKLYTGTGWAHLWYMYLVIGLYLLMPAFKKITGYSDTIELSVLILIYVLFLSVVPIINKLSGVTTAFYITTSSIFPAYLFAGHMIDSERWKVPGSVYILMTVSGIALIILISLLVIGNTPKDENQVFTAFLGSYSFLPVCIFSVGVFGIFKTYSGSKERKADGTKGILNKILLSIDGCSFGIYLIHLAFLRYAYKCTDLMNPSGIIVLKPLILSVVAFLLSYILVRLLRCIKPVRKII
ncbi:MAG: acyltransferase family protein [Eubacterium sp.]|nr:acyltransferase family protein [Eubacterium sp.]